MQYSVLSHIVKFGMSLSKLQGKGVTHYQEVEWWRTFRVECETLCYIKAVHTNESSRFPVVRFNICYIRYCLYILDFGVQDR